MTKVVLRWALALVMVGVGALHFFAADLFVQIVPPFLPSPRVLVWLSGVFEIGLGAALLPPGTRRLAGLGLTLLYVAVFPANLYMTFAHVQVHGLPLWISQPTPRPASATSVVASRRSDRSSTPPVGRGGARSSVLRRDLVVSLSENRG